MALQQGLQCCINPHAQAQYDRLCEKHGLSPTADDVEAIQRVIGIVNARSTIGGQFEAALLFFLPKSDIQLQQGALLIGWIQKDNGPKLQVWFKLGANDKGGLYHVPAGSAGSRYYCEGDIQHPLPPKLHKFWILQLKRESKPSARSSRKRRSIS